ncbi:transglycosylase domain-containing protein [Bacillus sp. FJAT-44742]|uniref:transglycosylase domain-containing protein n=1 Tax=Bacillus sp. FJAT-44742 TaxID=2014005 RepID=UPI000C2470E4|nr:transglycosylase domain-containing protein [Bacillus sp. FJAT-44742]
MKSFFERLNAKTDEWKDLPVVRGLNITSYVVWNLILILFVLLLMGTFFIGGAGAGYFVSLVEDEPARSFDEMEEELYDYEETSEIYFADEVYLGEISSDLERRDIEVDEVSDNLVNAIIATEDEYFFEHDGIVPKAIMRATFQEITGAANQTGGSTLTQQIVKNQMLSNEVSFDRKAREIMLAMRMEEFFEKEDILEAYLNIVPFGRNSNGQNIAGVQAAAEGIFGVDAAELNIPQAAFIAGLPQNPFGYTPFTSTGEVKDSFDAGLNRMQTVLNRMKASGYITEEEYEEAQAYDIEESLADPRPRTFDEYPYLTNEAQRRAIQIIREQLIEEDGVDIEGMDEEERQETILSYHEDARVKLANGGYQVHTTVNKDIYDNMQEAVDNVEWFGPDRQGEDGEVEPEEVGAVMIDNRTGAIISFVGGRDHSRESMNHATQGFRQNGSTMKPLLAYGPAMDRGELQPGTIVPDVPSTYSTGDEITNFNSDEYEGFIPVRESLVRSQNIPAVKALQRVEHEDAREDLINMGFTNLDENDPYESGAIGGLTNGATVEQNTAAYSLFANDGQYNDSYIIDRIETHDGEVIYEHEPEPREVFSAQTAYLMLDILRDVLGTEEGTATSLPDMLDFEGDWAGKTGTTNEIHDAWFVGFNPNVTFGVWLGYDIPQSLAERHNGRGYSWRTQRIWADFMNAAYEGDPEALGIEDTFEQPDGVVSQEICGISGMLPSDLCEEADLVTEDLFNEEFLPTEEDDSLSEVEYVTIDGTPYRALDDTPSEFTDNGIAVKEEYFDIDEDEDISDYLPDNWDNVIPDVEAPDNGRTPSSVSNISINSGELTWSQHSDNDIVGYRIYQASSESGSFSPVGVSKGNTNTSYNLGSGSSAYYVTAVDSAGRESSSSSTAVGEGSGSSGSTEDEDSEDNGSNGNNDDEGNNYSEEETDNNNEEADETGDSSESEENNEEESNINEGEGDTSNSSNNEEDSSAAADSGQEDNSSENPTSESSDTSSDSSDEESSSSEPSEENQNSDTNSNGTEESSDTSSNNNEEEPSPSETNGEEEASSGSSDNGAEESDDTSSNNEEEASSSDTNGEEEAPSDSSDNSAEESDDTSSDNNEEEASSSDTNGEEEASSNSADNSPEESDDTSSDNNEEEASSSDTNGEEEASSNSADNGAEESDDEDADNEENQADTNAEDQENSEDGSESDDEDD